MTIQYQDFLLEEFKTRRSRNPNYSLRAFARDLGMPASKLSQNLRGLCGISLAKAEKIAEKMQMRMEDRELFLALVESQHARSRVARQQAALALEKLRRDGSEKLSAEKFAMVRDWYHMAILEMTELKDFKPDVAWMANKLGLPFELVSEAVGRLRDLELLNLGDAKWTQSHKDLEISEGVPSRAIREHHAQLLSKAIAALEQVEFEKREFVAQTFAVDRALLPEMRSLMRDFQKKIARLSVSDTRNAVYVLAMQLFPVIEVES